jgi:beta-lactam-binding protein with PASTA domain
MPDLVGMTVREAQNELGKAGWTGLFEQSQVPTADPNENNRILDQQPKKGQPLSKDQTVRIQVGKMGNGTTTTTTTS